MATPLFQTVARAGLVVSALLAGCAPRPHAPTATSAAVVASSALRPLAAELAHLTRLHGGDTVDIAVALRDLASGDSLLLLAHEPMHAASTMKVPVMLELFRRAEAGELSLNDSLLVRNAFRSIADSSAYSLSPADDSDPELYDRLGHRVSIRELMRRMIVRSSNLATNLLIDLADPERIARTLAGLGASEMRVLRGVEDGPAFRRGMNNSTTAYGLMRTLEGVAGGRGISEASREEMLRILEEQEFRDMIPAGLPPGVRAGNKTGWITGIQHDGAIVFPAGRAPYVLVVLTRGFRDSKAGAAAAREISRAVYARLAAPDDP